MPSTDGDMTREEFQRLMTARVRAFDRGFAALVATVKAELPDDAWAQEAARTLASNIRNTFAQRYPFAREVLGDEEESGQA